MWISDVYSDSIRAFRHGTGTRVPGQDFMLSAAGSLRPEGIWSDGVTMWVADPDGDRIYAFDMATKQRMEHLEIDALDPDNDRPAGMWSDGVTLWVADEDDDIAYAYRLPPGVHLRSVELSGLELTQPDPYDPYSFEGRVPRGADTVTVTAMPVVESYQVAYSVDDADDVEGGFQWNLVLGENTLTVTVSEGADSREHTLRVLKVDVDELSDDASLSSLSVDGESVEGLSADVTDYRLRVGNNAALVTVAAVPTVAQAQVTFTPEDADAAEGYQVALVEGLNTVEVEVVATDGTVVVYTLVVGREPSAFGRDEFFDVEGLGPHHSVDVWGDGSTWWVAYDRRGSGAVDEVLAYDAVTGERVPDKDVASLNGEGVGNTSPQALWSDGSSLWVLDAWKSKVFRYSLADANYGAHLATGARLEGIGEDRARGLWSDGATTWVIDTGEDRVYAYDSATGARDSDEDFDTLAAAGNTEPYDLWSDGVVMWILDKQASGSTRTTCCPSSVWRTWSSRRWTPTTTGRLASGSDGTTMWVSDFDDHRVYAYAMLPGLRLRSLEVSGIELKRLGSSSYEGRVPRTVDTVTVTAVPVVESYRVAFGTVDADPDGGFPWDLVLGDNTLTVTVSDGADSREHTLRVLKVDADALSDDASLSSLTVDGVSGWMGSRRMCPITGCGWATMWRR